MMVAGRPIRQRQHQNPRQTAHPFSVGAMEVGDLVFFVRGQEQSVHHADLFSLLTSFIALVLSPPVFRM